MNMGAFSAGSGEPFKHTAHKDLVTFQSFAADRTKALSFPFKTVGTAFNMHDPIFTAI
jgi:hypothetical protein